MACEVLLVETEEVHGCLHDPGKKPQGHITLAHGAGSNRDAPLLIAIAETFCEAGFAVLRCDLPFRLKRPSGPPLPASTEADQQGLRNAANFMRQRFEGTAVLGGHSYGGRQASVVAANDPLIADALLLLSYPLHPPRKPDQLRTRHWSSLRTPSLFVHGTRDPFGSIEEMKASLRLIAAPVELFICQNAGHDLAARKFAVAGEACTIFRRFIEAR